MDQTKDCLVVVHASDKWLDSNLEPSESNHLKSLIKDRISHYITLGKPVFYTPYTGSDPEIPSYFPKHNAIKAIKAEDSNVLPGLNLLKFQAMAVLTQMHGSQLDSMEICGVRENACVKGTYNALKQISESDISAFSEYAGEDAHYIQCATSRKIDAIINSNATDSILWKAKFPAINPLLFQKKD